eukprot:m.124770 g.124770  ORF g.124770 m.124770 type:complete len:377 (-) comp29080_c0_seq1:83-1213(-)
MYQIADGVAPRCHGENVTFKNQSKTLDLRERIPTPTMFHTSSQRAHWMFPTKSTTPENRTQSAVKELDDLRKKAHNDSIARISKFYAEPVEFISQSDAMQIVDHCQYWVRSFCKQFNPNLPERVVATATMYLKRYYIRNSVLNHPPTQMMALCIFVACKVEEQKITMDVFIRIPNKPTLSQVDADFIRKFETHLLEELQFHIVVHHPFRPLKGLFVDINAKHADGNAISVESLEKARQLIFKWICSDAILIFPPSQLALASLYCVVDAAEKNSIDGYLEEITVGDADKKADQIVRVKQSIKEIQDVGNAVHEPNVDIKVLFAKLNGCRNPLCDPTSKLYKRRMAEAEESQNAKRRKKNEEWKKNQAETQLKFGGEK